MLELNQLGCNEAQKKAICHTGGPALVLAGPGSGKTFVITHRIQYLIQNSGISPENILVITFTKAAAIEMKQRTQKLVGNKCSRIIFGTFHSVFFNILKNSGQVRENSIISGNMKKRLLREIAEEEMIESNDYAELIRNLESDIASAKCKKINFDENCEKEALLSTSPEKFRNVYLKYTSRMEEMGLIDFEDMLVKTHVFLIHNREERLKWVNRFKYILIDEFQDIDPLQFDIIKLLLNKSRNIFAVGDDDQSIYSFRGACPQIMFEFEKLFPDVNKIFLNFNYRSCENIVKLAGQIISKNVSRFDKEIIAGREQGKAPNLPIFIDEGEEIQCFIGFYKSHCEKDTSIAILTRTNGGAEFFARRLMLENIPYTMNQKRLNIYEHFVARDIMTYMKLALGINKRALFFMVMNKPDRHLTRSLFMEEWVNFSLLYSRCEKKHELKANIIKLKADLEFMAKLRPYAALNYLLKKVGYEKYIKQYAAEFKIKYLELKKIIDELLDISKKYQSIKSWVEAAEGEILADIGGNNYAEADFSDNTRIKIDTKNISKAKVFISTLHASKGLEYDIVFIMDVAEGNIPYKKSILDEQIEEERRLFYVGITRARDEVFVCRVRKLLGKPAEESRFLESVEGV